MKPFPRFLLPLIVANVAATILHYVDNVMFFAHYPEPSWLNAHIVDLFWFVMTPFAVLGFVLWRRGSVHRASLALYAYSAMSLLVLGHYRYAPIGSIAFRINLFILLEAALAVILIVYVAAIQTRSSAHRPSPLA